MKKQPNIHPGEILLEEFLKPMQISAYRLSKNLRIPQTRISETLKMKRRITADTALRLSKYFGTTAKFWLGLQDDFDLEEEMVVRNDDISSIKELLLTSNYSIVCVVTNNLSASLEKLTCGRLFRKTLRQNTMPYGSVLDYSAEIG